MHSHLKIHLCWVIAVLTAIIILLDAVKWSGIGDLAGILNFALGLASFVLAILAIIYGFIANNAFAGTVNKIESAALKINDIVRDIPDRLNIIDQRMLDTHRLVASSQQQPIDSCII
jgi:hypothetical protein